MKGPVIIETIGKVFSLYHPNMKAIYVDNKKNITNYFNHNIL